MKIDVLSKTDFEMQFALDGVKPGFANELRRVMLSEIPTMAIEFVDFKKNNSVLNDEVVANRLGQIPLTFEKKSYNLPEECKCEGKGCSNCQVELILKKKGPAMVYSGDLKSTDKDVQPLFDKIPVVELFDGQEIQFEAIAKLGTGRKNAKWQGAVVGYKNRATVVINTKECTGERCVKCVEKCTKKILALEKDKIVITDPVVCNLCMQCVESCPKGAIKVNIDENAFIFNVESACGLKVDEVVNSAADVMEKKLGQFSKGVGKLK